MGFPTYDQVRLGMYRRSGSGPVFQLWDEISDVAIVQGRFSTGTKAGTALDVTSAYTYGEGSEFRYKVTDWTNVGSSFRGLYLRAESGVASSGKDIYGMELYGVANNFTTGGLKGLLAYAYIKGTSAKTVGPAYGVHGELSFDASSATNTITTEASAGLFKITGGVCDTYTKLHGVIIRAGDMDGASRTYGNGILIEDDSSMSGTITWTKGISITSPCTTGISLTTGAMTTGIALGSTMTTGISITGASTTAFSISAATQLGVSVTMAALTAGDAYSGIRSVVTSAAPSNSYGAAAYFEADLTGTQTASFVYGSGSWVNASATYSTSNYMAAQDNGVYIDTSATLTGAHIIFGLRMESLIGAVGSGITHGEYVFPFSLNTGNNGITALFECMTASDFGVVGSGGRADAAEYIPLFRDAGGTMRYLHLCT